MTSKTSKILSDEHKNILKIIEIMGDECDAIENGKEIDKEFFEKVIDFIRNYADKFHHAKEEDILFIEFNKLAEENPESLHCNPTSQMLVDHDQGREFVKGMETRLTENDNIRVIRNARAYADLLREHISKEDDILYPMTDEALSANTKKEMLKKFNKIDIERKMDKNKYLNLVKELGERK
jgi:hemerythrin-like domain-containing protein